MMAEAASKMRPGRLIFAFALVPMMAIAAQPASAQRYAQQFRPPKAPPPKAQGQKPKGNPNKSAAKPGNANAPHPNADGGSSNTNGANGQRNPNPINANNSGQPVAHPPNQETFRPNPNVAHPEGTNLPAGAEQRLRDMSPQEQERFLQNNQRFQSLPPERQAQIRRNLQKWNNLSPAEKDRLSHAGDRWEQMTPQQRDLYQNHILPKWQQMSPDRRQLINGRLHTLQAMPPAAQERALNDPRFMQGLSPDEQGVLRNLVSLRNPNP